ncbi:MAG TPA: DUF4157 domain-containing protein, partial [Pyrinomonadaceae bacterium]|nr:DUF4157 domain-containing protein [Pyrinomonadaceae bacterium]
MQRLLDSPYIQAKLQISTPEDSSELEADRVADTVMRMPGTEFHPGTTVSDQTQTPRLQRKCAGCEEEARRQPSEGVEGIIQAKPSAAQTPVVQRLCSGCRATPLRSAISPGPAPAAPSIVHDVLRSPGQPLDASARAFMEPRFGLDFSRVRVHTDAEAEESARAVNARSYAAGEHLIFGRGEYRPGSAGGLRLLAHELAHVVQQGDSGGTQGLKIQRTRLLDFSNISRPEFEPSVLTDAQIEATNEFRAYMDPTL